MKKLLNLLLLLSTFFAYLEWGKGYHAFVYEMEIMLFRKAFTDIASVVHPLTILPLAGQLLLVVSLFQTPPRRWITFTSLISIGLLFILIFITGLLAHNWKITLSVLPFILLSLFVTKLNLHRNA